MTKHILLFWTFLKTSAIAELEYRLNFVVKVIGDVIWYCAQISVFEVLFTHTQSLAGGWTLATSRVFLAVLFMTDSLYMMIFQENLDRLSIKVRKGELDLLLTKPVSAQFMMSFQRMNPSYFINFLLTLGYLSWAILRLDQQPSWDRYLFLVVLVPCSLAVSYSFRFFFSASAFIFQNAESVSHMWHQFYRLGTRPDTLYPRWLRGMVFFILPVAFLASVPTRVLLSMTGWEFSLLGVAIASISVFLTTKYWAFAMKRYSSASS